MTAQEAVKRAFKILESAYNNSRTIGDGKVTLKASQWDTMTHLLGEIERSQCAGEWIAVSLETMPEPWKDYGLIVNGGFNDPVCGYYDEQKKLFVWLRTSSDVATCPVERVTHYCELRLPTPPERSKE